MVEAVEEEVLSSANARSSLNRSIEPAVQLVVVRIGVLVGLGGQGEVNQPVVWLLPGRAAFDINRFISGDQTIEHRAGGAKRLLEDHPAVHREHRRVHIATIGGRVTEGFPNLLSVDLTMSEMTSDQADQGAHRIRGIDHEVGQAIAVKIGGKNDVLLLVELITQQLPVVEVGDVHIDITAPLIHSVLEVGRQKRDDLSDPLLVLFVGVDLVVLLHRELGALQQPVEKAGQDAVLHRLGGLDSRATDLLPTRLVNELEEVPSGIGHANARSVHLGVNNSLVGHFEDGLVLRVRKPRHVANTGRLAVGTNVTEDPSLRAEFGVSGLAFDDHRFATGVLDHPITSGRPLDRCARVIAEPLERGQVAVMAILSHEWNPMPGKSENFCGGDGANQRVFVRNGVADRDHVAVMKSAFPDNGIRAFRNLEPRAGHGSVEPDKKVFPTLVLCDFQ